MKGRSENIILFFQKSPKPLAYLTPIIFSSSKQNLQTLLFDLLYYSFALWPSITKNALDLYTEVSQFHSARFSTVLSQVFRGFFNSPEEYRYSTFTKQGRFFPNPSHISFTSYSAECSEMLNDSYNCAGNEDYLLCTLVLITCRHSFVNVRK